MCACVCGCPRIRVLSMFHTNLEICNSALHWPGAGRQLCRNWVTWDARALLWRRAPLHTQHRWEVMASPCPLSNLTILQSLMEIAVSIALILSETSLIGKCAVCFSPRPLMPLPLFFASLIRKSLTLKYYAKKILYFLRQQNILKSLKSFLEKPADQQSALEGIK